MSKWSRERIEFKCKNVHFSVKSNGAIMHCWSEESDSNDERPMKWIILVCKEGDGFCKFHSEFGDKIEDKKLLPVATVFLSRA